MSRIVLACALLALTPALAGAAPEGHEQKHSGVIVDVAPEQRTITVDEMGPWTAGAPDRVTRTIAVPPSTRIELAVRSETPGADGWPGGFQESTLGLSDLRPGDFATVTTEHGDGRLVASSIAVVRPSSSR